MSTFLSMLLWIVAASTVMSVFAQNEGLGAGRESQEAPPVTVKVLEESLCPGCKELVQDQLAPVFSELGTSVMDVQVVPFGNARFVPDKHDPSQQVLECQHGPPECDANSYEQCVVLSLYPYPTQYLPFLDCLYDKLPIGKQDKHIDPSVYPECAQAASLDWDAIQGCHENALLAQALQQVAYAMTPDYHQYVPWVEVNGEHVEMEDDDSLMKAVCVAYASNGGSSPKCEKLLRAADGDTKTNQKVDVCLT